jgi:cell wall-associated NlpC family hydrolase
VTLAGNRARSSRPAAFLIALLLGLLAGCSSAPAPIGQQSASGRAVGKAQAEVQIRAMGLIGAPYRYGGSSPATGFDCSGLIHYVYREAAGVDLPRTTAELGALNTEKPPADALQPGDLVLFRVKGGRKVNHAGIYAGDGHFVHAPSSGGQVRLDRLDDRYWQRCFAGARRVLN